MATAPRRPKAVRMDDDTVTVAPPPPRDPGSANPAPHRGGDHGTGPDALVPAPTVKTGFSWFGAFTTIMGAILSLAFGLWVEGLIRALFERTPALGWIGVGLAGLLCLLVFSFIWREVAAIARQSHIDSLREKAASVVASDDRFQGLRVIDALLSLFSNRPETARGRAELKGLRDDIIDGAALIGLAEKHLLAPLDKEGISLVTNAAKRVSVVTAISPRAIVDVGYVLFESVRLVRSTAQLYGARPGFLGFLRLTSAVVAHLAVTGGVAIGDSLLQQALGTGLASRISARLGEGVLNGFLTARVGLAALDVCRPLPYSDASRPTLSQVMGSILSSQEKKAEGDR